MVKRNCSALLVLIACVAVHFRRAAESSKPNLVVTVAEDLGYADVLFNPLPPKEVATPNLDALAKSH